MVEVAECPNGLIGFDHGHGGFAPNFLGFLQKIVIARQAKDIIDSIIFTPPHQVFSGKATVPTHQNLHPGPSITDYPDNAPDDIA